MTTAADFKTWASTLFRPGTYTATLTLTDPNGVQVSTSSQVTVAPLPPMPPVPVDPLLRPLLNQANLTLLGSFRLPVSDGKDSTAFSMGGLTHRRVNGQLRFLTTSHVYQGGLVYEVADPGHSLVLPPQAPVVQHWGDVYDGRKWTGNDGGNDGLSSGTWTYGLHFDQGLNRLYWNYGHWYNATHPDNPSLGYSVLSEAAKQGIGVASYSFQGRSEKFCRGGTLRIPQWFANRYTGGKSLGAGFGGYFSIVNSASLGPALTAVSDPNTAFTNADRSALPNTPLLGYPASAPVRCRRDPDYRTEYDQAQPVNGVGAWTWSDIIYGGATWIDLPDVHGLLFLAKVGQGRVWYEGSDRHAERGSYAWFVYDPKDLALVATGAKKEWEIQPARSWLDKTLPMPLDKQGWAGDGFNMVGGCTFDVATRRLYVLVTGAWKQEVESHPQVFVYQV